MSGSADGNGPRGLIAEDEPLLARALAAELSTLWPALALSAPCGDGRDAIARLLSERPDIAFLDVRMPGASGLEVAAAVAEDWPSEVAPPLLVFVTAYDEFAVQAFEHAAVDYVLKPVRRDRLARTVERLRARLAERASPGDEPTRPGDPAEDPAAPGAATRASAPGGSRTADAGSIDAMAARLRELLRATEAATAQPPATTTARGEPLRFLRAGVGDVVRLIPVESVAILQADDKYVAAVTRDGEALLRESLRELLLRLDPADFVQVHRSTVVNLRFVEAAVRDDTGRMRLRLRGLQRQPIVSRLHTHLFRPM